MIRHIFFLMVFTGLAAQAQFVDEIWEDFCSYPEQGCSAQQVDIVKSYFAGHEPEGNFKDALFVGSCYMLGRSYQSDYEQFGYIYLRANNHVYDFFGEFAFFYPENPYEALSLETARKLHSQPGKDSIFAQNQHWQSNISENPLVQYFARQDEKGQLLLIGLWGRDDAVICRMHSK